MADTITISVKDELGIAKPFKVKTSNKNMRKVYQIQVDMAEAKNTENSTDDSVEIAKVEVKTIGIVVNFITDILNLNDKQKQLVEELSVVDTVKLANRINLRMQGYSDEAYELAVKEAESKNE